MHGLRFVCAGPPTPAVFCEKPLASLVELCNFVGDELSGLKMKGANMKRAL